MSDVLLLYTGDVDVTKMVRLFFLQRWRFGVGVYEGDDGMTCMWKSGGQHGYYTQDMTTGHGREMIVVTCEIQTRSRLGVFFVDVSYFELLVSEGEFEVRIFYLSLSNKLFLTSSFLQVLNPHLSLLLSVSRSKFPPPPPLV